MIVAPSGAPTISVADVSSYSIQLQWTALLSQHQNGLITGYVLRYWSERDGNNSVHVDRTWHTISVNPYTTYWLSVAAENSAGQGPFSESAIVETLQDGKFYDYILIGLQCAALP